MIYHHTILENAKLMEALEVAQAPKGPSEIENFLRTQLENAENELKRLRQRDHERVTKEDGYQIEVSNNEFF